MHAPQRYSAVAIALHWLIAGLILAQVGLGVAMVDWVAKGSGTQFTLFQWHKSLGITVLLLTLARIAWRLSHPPPPLPDGMRGWERALARGTHLGFYLLMLAMPLTGWALVSASPLDIPTVLFGVIPWPHLPILPTVGDKEAVSGALAGTHEWLARLVLALLALHVAGALKHHLAQRDGVLARMVPGLRGRA